MGRVNYGPRLKDAKGITEGVRLDNQFQFDWTIYPLPLTDLSALPFTQLASHSRGIENPMFFKGELIVNDIADTFVRLDRWTKGVVWINGFNLGRYWEKGPQKTLYVPGPLLRKGRNEIVILELHGTDNAEIELVDAPDLG